MMLVSQYAEITEKKQLVMSGGLGTMGYGFPAAIGAQIGNPEKRVIAVSGDGGMQMNIQEFATAVLEETPVIACVFNNTYRGDGASVAEAVLRKTLWDDQSARRSAFETDRWSRISGVYAGFCKTGRKLLGQKESV